MTGKPSSFAPLAILTASYAVGFVGTLAINSAIGFWYVVIQRPAWAAPNWLLVPAWMALHGLFGGAGWSLWVSEEDDRAKKRAIWLLAISVVLNAAWAMTLFYGHKPLPAFVVACVLWLCILAATFSGWRVQDLAGRLLLPCFLWITYALALTGAVWRLNR